MCTLIAFHRVWGDAPLVLAVNRDEAYERPSSPPEWTDGDPRALAPRDEREGGTWMGATEIGLWVGLTNRHEGDTDPGRRSRGLLCTELLRAGGPEDVVERVGSLEERYNPFHLVTGDGRMLWRVEYDGGVVDASELPAGCHVVTNRPRDAAEAEPKVQRVRTLLRERGLGFAVEGDEAGEKVAPADLEARLAGVLADHGREGPDALCLHGGVYGTKSAAVWRIRPARSAGPEIRLAFADGPPCCAPMTFIE